jgi:hypothetical protein
MPGKIDWAWRLETAATAQACFAFAPKSGESGASHLRGGMMTGIISRWLRR